MTSTLYAALADAVLVIHLGFILFVVAGGLLVIRWRRAAWFHVPAVLWGAAVEFGGGWCPLTPVETWLRLKAGEAALEGGFIAHYLLPLIYPAALTREMQVGLGLFVVLLNGAVYARVWRTGIGETPDSGRSDKRSNGGRKQIDKGDRPL